MTQPEAVLRWRRSLQLSLARILKSQPQLRRMRELLTLGCINLNLLARCINGHFHKGENRMTGSRGTITACPMYSADDLKISNPDQCVHLVIKEFLKKGEGEARCCIQMPRGILLLHTLPPTPPPSPLSI